MYQLPVFACFNRSGLVIIRAMNSPCILLIDDHAILLEGLRMLLETKIDGVRVATASSLSEAIMMEAMPDAIVLDIMLSGVSGLEGVASLQRKWPQARIVMLSSQDDTDTRQRALARGAVGFVSKTEAGEQIVEAIYNALRGQVAVSQARACTVQQYLTPRQCEVLDLLNQGLTNKMIAKKLALSDNTVRRHVQDIFAFFGVASRTEAVFAARRQGLVA
jgi:DNA-binding NarL/FixJ family response regulator